MIDLTIKKVIKREIDETLSISIDYEEPFYCGKTCQYFFEDKKNNGYCTLRWNNKEDTTQLNVNLIGTKFRRCIFCFTLIPIDKCNTYLKTIKEFFNKSSNKFNVEQIQEIKLIEEENNFKFTTEPSFSELIK